MQEDFAVLAESWDLALEADDYSASTRRGTRQGDRVV